MKLQVRKLQESDWEFLPKWWKHHGQIPWMDNENFRDFLPGALPTAAISDPEYKDTDRKQAIQLLVNFVTNFSKELGYKYAFGWAQEGYMLDYYLKAGYEKFQTPSYELIKKL